jgi:GT2 family glycosyltransferase
MNSIVCGYPLENPSSDKTDIQNYKAAQSVKWTSAFSENLNLISADKLFLSAASMSIHKKTFDSLNGFDERLTDIEDLEFAKRAIEKKVLIYFDKGNKAIHRDLITCKSYINRVRQYTNAQQYLHRLYPEKFPNRKSISSSKRIFYSAFSLSIFPRLIDSNRLLKILPTALRYKIYDWVIYSQGVVFAEKKLN